MWFLSLFSDFHCAGGVLTMAILTEIESVKALTAGPLVHATLSAARLVEIALLGGEGGAPGARYGAPRHSAPAAAFQMGVFPQPGLDGTMDY